MKFLKSVAIIIIFSISLSFVSCENPIEMARNPERFPGTTWIANDGEVSIVLHVEEYPFVRQTGNDKEDNGAYPYPLYATMLCEIKVGEASYECFAFFEWLHTLVIVSQDLPHHSEGNRTQMLKEHTLAILVVSKFKSKTDFVAEVYESNILKAEKSYHFYRDDSE